MIAKFTRGDDGRLGIRFEPEIFEEQLLLDQFTRDSAALGHRFEFSGWEHNHAARTLREGLTSCWGQIVPLGPRAPVVAEDQSAEARGAPAAEAPAQTSAQPSVTWISTRGAPVIWHVTGFPIQIDGMSRVASPSRILMLCGTSVLDYQVRSTSQRHPGAVDRLGHALCAACASVAAP